MALQTRDREFRHPRISYLDFKLLEMDRVLTSFLARVWHNGYPSRILRNIELTVEDFVNEFVEHPEWFADFQSHRDITKRWVETHLMDVVNRGKANQAIAAHAPCTDLRTGFVTQNTHVPTELMNICMRCSHMLGNSGAPER